MEPGVFPLIKIKNLPIKTLGNKIPYWVKEHKKAALALGITPIAVPLFYFADVWVLGSLAAGIHDTMNVIRNLISGFNDTASSWNDIPMFGSSEEKKATAAAIPQTNAKVMPYYLKHPISTGWAWLTKPSESLSYPEVKHIWLWLNSIFGAVSAGIYSWWRLKKQYSKANAFNRVHGLKIIDNPAYGTSRWAGLKDVKSFCEFGPPVPLEKNKNMRIKFPGGNVIGELDGRILRVNFDKMPTNTPKTAPHAIFYGGTGSGKSFSIVIGNIIAAVSEGQSIIVIDPKGELFATVGKWLKERGYENVWVLNFMQPEHSHRWDPVIECRNDAEISEMIDTLSKNASSGSNSYFALKAMELMEAFIGLLKGDFPVEQQHMRSLMTLASWPEEKLDERFKNAYQAGKISPMIYERWRGVVKKNYEYAVSNLTAVLKNLTTAPLAAMMSEQEIDLNQLGQKKTALFLIIPTGGEGIYLKPILSILYKFIFRRLDKLAFRSPGQKLPVGVRNIWDEMANVGMIPGLPEIISTARSKGIHIQMILQTPTQLESVYGQDDAKIILGNCPTAMLIGVAPADRELARMFSGLLGSAPVEIEKVSEDLTVPGRHLFEFKKKERTVIERPLMTIDEILRLDPRYSIALLQWSYPVYLRKVGWVELPQAKEIQECGMLPVEEVIPARGFDVSLPEVEPDNDMSNQNNIESTSILWQQVRQQSSTDTQAATSVEEHDPSENDTPDNNKKASHGAGDNTTPDLSRFSNEVSNNIRLEHNQPNNHPTIAENTQGKGPEEPVEPEEPGETAEDDAIPTMGDIDSQGFNVKSPLFKQKG
jgi:type IV secretory pathway TraG/TraD family ATPase VirD4